MFCVCEIGKKTPLLRSLFQHDCDSATTRKLRYACGRAGGGSSFDPSRIPGARMFVDPSRRSTYILTSLSSNSESERERERDACETELKETRRNRTKHSETETDTCRCKILVLTYTWDYVHTRVHPLTRKCVWTRAYTRPRLA